MTSVLRRRLARIEAELRAAPGQAFTILVEPEHEATAIEWQAHREAISTSQLRGDRIGVVRSPDSVDQDQQEVGVEYFDNEIHAWLAMMVSQKSQQGRANRLADVLASLNGAVHGVVTDPVESEENQ